MKKKPAALEPTTRSALNRRLYKLRKRSLTRPEKALVDDFVTLLNRAADDMQDAQANASEELFNRVFERNTQVALQGTDAELKVWQELLRLATAGERLVMPRAMLEYLPRIAALNVVLRGTSWKRLSFWTKAQLLPLGTPAEIRAQLNDVANMSLSEVRDHVAALREEAGEVLRARLSNKMVTGGMRSIRQRWGRDKVLQRAALLADELTPQELSDLEEEVAESIDALEAFRRALRSKK